VERGSWFVVRGSWDVGRGPSNEQRATGGWPMCGAMNPRPTLVALVRVREVNRQVTTLCSSPSINDEQNPTCFQPES
jgi:hypothetical protein